MNMHGLALPRVCMPKAREAALTALAIDEDLAPARSALAAVTCLYDGDTRPPPSNGVRR